VGARAASVERGQGAVRTDEEQLASEELTQWRPQQRPDGEAQDEERDAQRRDLGAHVELGHDLANTTRVGRRDERDGQRCEGNNHGDGPFLHGAEQHGIAGVIGDPLDDVRVLFRAGARVGVVEDLRSDDALVRDQAPVGDALRPGGFDVVDPVVRHGGAGCVSVSPRALFV